MGESTALQDAEAAMRLAEQDPGRAIPVARAAAQRARRSGDPAAVAVAERAWGHGLVYCGDMDGAIRHLRRSIDSGRRAGSAPLAGAARTTLAYVLAQRGRPGAAVAEIDAAVQALDGIAGARARAQRATILHQAGRFEQAMAGFDGALADLRGLGDTLGIQRTLVNRALLHTDLFAFAAAETDLWEADRLATELGRQLSIGIIAENLALVTGLRGDLPAALAHLDRAEQAITAQRGQLGALYRDRAELLLTAGLVTEARTSAERALAELRRERRLLRVPEVRLLIAQAAFLDGDPAAALAQARRARQEFDRQRRSEWAGLARLESLRAQLAGEARPRVRPGEVAAMVDVLAATGWPAVAVEARLVAARLSPERVTGGPRQGYLAQAGSARRAGPAALRARGWYAEALLRHERGDHRGATGAARAGLRILDEHSAALGAADLRAHAAVHRMDLVRLGLRLALDSGRPRRVFEWAERGRATHLLHRPVRPPQDDELARLLAELRATASEVAGLLQAGRSASAAVRRQVGLERRIRDRSRLLPGSSAGRLPAPVSPTALGRALGEAALVEYLHAGDTLHALTLVAGRLRLRPLGPLAGIDGLMQRLPFALHRMARGPAAPPGSREAALVLLRDAAARLDRMLLGPLPELAGRPLVLVPTGPLHSMPWSVLPSCAGRPVTVAPSATLWCSPGNGASAARDAAGAGGAPASGPPAPGAVDAGAVDAGVVVAAGPRLPGARQEAAAVAAIHGTCPLVGEAATVDAVLAALGTAGVAHLAAHGRLSAENPLFSDLLLADGPLYVYDLEQLPRVPHTVVLAACDSGRPVVRTGDELLGLAATFLARGAAQLVAPVLPVPDVETAPLMVAFHRRLAAGQPPAVALAAAQYELRDADPAALAAAAGFVCLGSAG